MQRSRSFALTLTAVGGALFLAGVPLPVEPRGSADRGGSPRSVYGTLQSVDRNKNTVVMRSDGGEVTCRPTTRSGMGRALLVQCSE